MTKPIMATCAHCEGQEKKSEMTTCPFCGFSACKGCMGIINDELKQKPHKIGRKRKGSRQSSQA